MLCALCFCVVICAQLVVRPVSVSMSVSSLTDTDIFVTDIMNMTCARCTHG